MGSISLTVDGIKDKYEAEAVRTRRVFEQLGQLDCQLRHGFAPWWRGVRIQGICYLGHNGLVKMAGCDALC